jgi:hypothetical protein
MKFIAILILAAGIAAAGNGSLLPDHTPGVANPEVTQQNIHQTICMAGWTKTIRPSSGFTTKLKILQMRDLGLPGKPSNHEEDHFRPLELGGAPHDPDNLDPPPGCINGIAHHPALVIPPSAALRNPS